MLNEVRQHVTTYPGTGQVATTPGAVVTSMIDLWDAHNALYHIHYNYKGILWNIQRRFSIFETLILTQKLTN